MKGKTCQSNDTKGLKVHVIDTPHSLPVRLGTVKNVEQRMDLLRVTSLVGNIVPRERSKPTYSVYASNVTGVLQIFRGNLVDGLQSPLAQMPMRDYASEQNPFKASLIGMKKRKDSRKSGMN